MLYQLVRVINCLCGCARAVRSKLRNYFVYNGPLRLFAETFFNLYLAALINIMADQEDDDESE